MSSRPVRSAPSRRATLAACAAALLALGLAHHRVYSIPFLYSEVQGIQHSEVVRSLTVFRERMLTPRGLVERPLSVLSYALNHAVHGEDVWGYHLVNVSIHAANAVLVVLLARHFGASPLVAGLSFALHPLASSCVSQIFGRNYSLATLFSLAALLVQLRSTGARSWSRLCLVGLLLALAVLSKQTLVAFALVLLWFELFRPGRAAVASSRISERLLAVASSRSGKLAALAAAAFASAGLALVWVYALPLSRTAAIPPLDFLLSQLGHLPTLAALYLLPYRTALVHDLPAYRDPLHPDVLIGAVGVGVLLAVTWRFRAAATGQLLGALLLCLLPTNTLLPKNEIIREWRLYPSLAFFALLAGVAAARAADLLRARAGAGATALKLLAASALAAWLALFAHSDLLQNRHYQSALGTWQQVLERYPDSADALNNLATIQFSEGQLELALRGYQRATAAEPRVALYRRNLARTHAALGDLDEARQQMAWAREIESRYGSRTMAVRYAGESPRPLAELVIADPGTAPDDAPARVLDAPERYARLVPRADFPGASGSAISSRRATTLRCAGRATTQGCTGPTAPRSPRDGARSRGTCGACWSSGTPSSVSRIIRCITIPTS